MNERKNRVNEWESGSDRVREKRGKRKRGKKQRRIGGVNECGIGCGRERRAFIPPFPKRNELTIGEVQEKVGGKREGK